MVALAEAGEIAAAIANADVNARGEHGRTPLHYAARYDTPENVSALIKAGADASLTNKRGETPFDLAEHNDEVKGSGAYRQLRDAR